MKFERSLIDVLKSLQKEICKHMDNLKKIINKLRTYTTEEEWFEFKDSWYDEMGIGEYISSMSNVAAMQGREYAYLVWGVDDETHELTDTKFSCHKEVKGEPLEHYLARKVTPDIGFSFHEIKIEGKRVVVLVIPAAKNAPTAFNGVRYLRIGSSKVNLSKYPERESQLFYILRFGLPTICNTEAEFQDLTFDKLFVYYASKGITLNKRSFKKNLGLLTENGKYNLFAQLVSDNSHMPVRFAIFSGTTKASTMYSVKEFGNTCLLYSIDKVLEYGDVLNIPQADERGRVVERKEVPLFDAGAFREAIINAFVHNQWITGNAPMITFFSDRIEILSRGAIPPRQTIDGFFAGESVPVNQRLSDMLLQLHISERTGRGVPKITEVYGKGIYEFRENSIVVTIPLTRVSSGGITGLIPPDDMKNPPDNAKNPPDHPLVTVGTIRGRNAIEESILEFCKEPKGIWEIGDMLHYKDKKTIRKYLNPLVEGGRLALTLPDKPHSKFQKYIKIE